MLFKNKCCNQNILNFKKYLKKKSILILIQFPPNSFEILKENKLLLNSEISKNEYNFKLCLSNYTG